MAEQAVEVLTADRWHLATQMIRVLNVLPTSVGYVMPRSLIDT